MDELIAKINALEAEKEMVYTKTKLDKRLFDILGEKYFVPWEERYG